MLRRYPSEKWIQIGAEIDRFLEIVYTHGGKTWGSYVRDFILRHRDFKSIDIWVESSEIRETILAKIKDQGFELKGTELKTSAGVIDPVTIYVSSEFPKVDFSIEYLSYDGTQIHAHPPYTFQEINAHLRGGEFIPFPEPIDLSSGPRTSEQILADVDMVRRRHRMTEF